MLDHPSVTYFPSHHSLGRVPCTCLGTAVSVCFVLRLVHNAVDASTIRNQLLIFTIPPHKLQRNRLIRPQLSTIYLSSMVCNIRIGCQLTYAPIIIIERIVPRFVRDILCILDWVNPEALHRHDDRGEVQQIEQGRITPPYGKGVDDRGGRRTRAHQNVHLCSCPSFRHGYLEVHLPVIELDVLFSCTCRKESKFTYLEQLWCA